MKISNDQYAPVVNPFQSDPVGNKNGASQSNPQNVTQGGDRVELSINSGDIEQLKQTVQGMSSDVNADRVASLKTSIADGTYSVSGQKVAEKMLENWKALNADN
jgi:flagellar biosynthesis anti-sigma factor FlgM